jgi:tetratricopeptide (TPR) repeat protein
MGPRERRAAMRAKVKEAIQERREQRAAETVTVEPPAPAPSGSGMFSAADVPDLLRKAAAYSGRGEYHKAIITYEEILRVDPRNVAAREGLARARQVAKIR